MRFFICHLMRKNVQMIIKEVIVVEGRDDTAAVKRACEAETIETHGYGIRKETWDLMDMAYRSKGIIIFTDPDRAGLEIRKRVLKRYPDAKEAFLTRDRAIKDGDIGIENAEPAAIVEALSKVCTRVAVQEDEFTMNDLVRTGLTGPGSREKRQAAGSYLGIGYGNAQAFLRKLNSYGITREKFEEAAGKSITHD